ncbi:uracil DNA glycosylase superfamily protein [Microbacterium sp. AG157]|uniref:uracil-DNA glycosylase n=1 Tax=Microbacterium sp. AG157 TaxID=2183993 RepID=UPI000E381F73|nr:uracil-DNA glycosylase [Microbacterium sp. AG157]REC97859.1 uracil DNA glycosylase superfamily protein [Microbacterium sp. AG157]
MTGTDEPADVRALNALAETWRTSEDGTRRFVPGFDPLSGGTVSRVLVLMQSPGPQTIAAGSAAICSEDNPGPTATALRAARIESGLSRTHYLRWNLVPWEISGRVRPVDVEQGRLALGELLELLPTLRAVVTYGAVALDGAMRHLTLREDPRVVPVLAAPHPSPANGRHRADQHLRSVNALRLAARL